MCKPLQAVNLCWLSNGDSKQVLIDYEQYRNSIANNTVKPFVSLYEAFANAPDELASALAEIDDNDEDDFSFVYDLTLVTRNTKYFTEIDELKLISPFVTNS